MKKEETRARVSFTIEVSRGTQTLQPPRTELVPLHLVKYLMHLLVDSKTHEYLNNFFIDVFNPLRIDFS